MLHISTAVGKSPLYANNKYLAPLMQNKFMTYNYNYYSAHKGLNIKSDQNQPSCSRTKKLSYSFNFGFDITHALVYANVVCACVCLCLDVKKTCLACYNITKD